LGPHSLTIVAIDPAGNVSTAYTTTGTYTAPVSPTVSVVPTNVSLLIDGSALVSVHLVLSDGQIADVATDTAGAGTADFTAPDGRYEVIATATDRRGVASAPVTVPLLVDTISRKLKVKVVKKAAQDGDIVVRVRAEEGTKVHRSEAQNKIVARSLIKKSYRVGSSLRTLRRDDVGEGKYLIPVTAKDKAGNTTRRNATGKISD
jgi:hypothetical protein